MFTAGILAGILSGLFIGIVHQFTTVQIIQHAEVFELASEAAEPLTMNREHDIGAWKPSNDFERMAYTILADMLAGVGFALLLVAGFAIAGMKMDWQRGFYWGAAAFVAFMLAPDLGLPPEVPGTAAAPLAERQLWWASTVMLTIIALVLLYRRPAHPLGYVVALALIVLPHLIGAPQPAVYQNAAPQSLIHSFVVATMISGLLFWILTGAVAGVLYQRLVQPLTVPPFSR
jgi:cobalt transporter subunit CbtA